MTFRPTLSKIDGLLARAKKFREKHVNTFDIISNLDAKFKKTQSEIDDLRVVKVINEKEGLLFGSKKPPRNLEKRDLKTLEEDVGKTETALRAHLATLMKDRETCQQLKSEAETLQPKSLQALKIGDAFTFLDNTYEAVLAINEPQDKPRTSF